VRWWGVGKGYFRNALSIVLFVLLGGTFVALLWLRDVLRPVTITVERANVPLAERLFHKKDSIPSGPTLGDLVVFSAICDSCIQELRMGSIRGDTTCNSIVSLSRQIERRLAAELNRYGWSATRFSYYRTIALAIDRDSVPTQFRWLLRCTSPSHNTKTPMLLDSTVYHAARFLLLGKIWWLQHGLVSLTREASLSVRGE
jgi:hypothetical protein